MALEIKGLQRIFKFRKDSKELVLREEDKAVYRFKTTIGVKG